MKTDSFDESEINYELFEPNDSIRALAGDVPRIMGNACEGEGYLSSKLLDVRQVCTRSEQTDPILRVDYEFWTASSPFDVSNPERVTYRREHLYVRTRILEEHSFLTHGLRSEYGFEEWFNDDTTEGSPEQTRLPDEGYAVLLECIGSNHFNAISEYLVDDEESIPQGIRADLQKLYSAIAMDRTRSDKTWAQKVKKQERERQLEKPAWDPASLCFTRSTNRATLTIYSPEKQFVWTMSVPLLADKSNPTIELSKGKKVPSPLNYFPVSKATVESPCLMSSETVENALRDLFISGWLSQQLDSLK